MGSLRQSGVAMLSLAFMGMLAVGALATSAEATLVITLDQVFSGFTPGGSGPYLKATFEDVIGGVKLTLDDLGLSTGEKISEWDFNTSNLAGISKITYDSGVKAKSVGTGSDKFQADGDGKYDISFQFSTSSPLFTVGSQSVYLISGTGISENDFNTLSTPAGGSGPFTSAAHVQGIANATDPDKTCSGWVSDSKSGGSIATKGLSGPCTGNVAEPSVLFLSGFGLLLTAGLWRRMQAS